MQDLWNTIRKTFPPIHKEGHIFIIIFLVATLLLGMLWAGFGFIGLIATLWCVYFFRNPSRVVPDKEGLVVSPADGLIQEITEATPPPELELDNNEKRTRISIFLNVFDVHVNRVPVAGKVTALHYFPGKFFNASLDKASEENERQSAAVTTPDGKEVIFVQIAGLIARRIVCNLKQDQEVKTGERYGIIRFGSRADIYLPKGANPLIIEGQRAIGGETILADLNGREKARTGKKV